MLGIIIGEASKSNKNKILGQNDKKLVNIQKRRDFNMTVRFKFTLMNLCMLILIQ